MTKQKPDNIVFVDNDVWNEIEIALVSCTKVDFSQLVTIPRLRVNPDKDPINQKVWPCIYLYDAFGNRISFVRGGKEAEQEYLQELNEETK